MPKPSERTKELFRAVAPEDGRVVLKPMFGQLAGFVNGNMFSGIFGEDVFVRVGEEDQAALLKEKGAALFAPMEGRPMKGYVVLPRGWQKDPGKVREWVERAMETVATMPAKEPKGTKAAKAANAAKAAKVGVAKKAAAKGSAKNVTAKGR
jgi:TfoX/Sxy family transcriptional regulator of competence genes